MIIHGKVVKEKLLQGINLVANTVKPTLGPQAKTVILEGNPPVIINDGVTITRYISHEDPYVQMGVQMVQNLAAKAQDSSGDGTTTACIIAQALCNGIMELDSTLNFHNLRNEFENLQEAILDTLNAYAEVIEDSNILNVATIAANNDYYLGGLIQEAINKVGREGIVTVEESKTHETELIVRDGLKLDEGYLSHLMVNGEDGKATLENPLVFMSNLPIRNFQDIHPMLDIAIAKRQPLLIICKGMDGSALQNLLMNLLNKTVECTVILAPNFGDAQLDELNDVASLIGGKVFNNESKDDPKLVAYDEFGQCDRIVISKESTVILGGSGDTSELVSSLRAVAEDMKGHDKARIKSRIARLNGGVATIRIGAGSQLEMREKKERLDDALNATKAALAEGICVGGGLTLWNISQTLPTGTVNDIVIKALQAPLNALVTNSGHVLLHDTVNANTGFNALTGMYCNLRDEGVFDPVKVTKNSFIAAMSIASLFLTTEVAVLLPEE